MKRLARAALLSVLVLLPSVSACAETLPIPGYDRMDVPARHRAQSIAASLWYPAGRATYRNIIGDSVLFEGAPAMVGAAVAEGRYPLLLLSHGSGGAMEGLAWLSSRLAARGAIVLAVNHPGTTSGDSSPRRTMRLAPRAADLGAAQHPPPANGPSHPCWAAVDVGPNGSGLAARLPGARHVSVAPAHHFTFLGVCKEGGAELLRKWDDDPICDDPQGTDRAKAHEEIVGIVAKFLGLASAE